MNTENIKTNSKSQDSNCLGIGLIVVGGLLSVLGTLYWILDAYIYFKEGYLDVHNPIFYLNPLIIGIPLLMIGIGLLLKPKWKNENNQIKIKIHKIMGWIMSYAGGLLILWGLRIVYEILNPGLHAQRYDIDMIWILDIIWVEGILTYLPGPLFGIPLLVVGIKWMKGEAVNRNAWGWVMAINGGLLLGWGILWSYYFSQHWYGAYWLIESLPQVLLGFLLVIIGIRWITNKGKTSPVKITRSDDLQPEIKE